MLDHSMLTKALALACHRSRRSRNPLEPLSPSRPLSPRTRPAAVCAATRADRRTAVAGSRRQRAPLLTAMRSVCDILTALRTAVSAPPSADINQGVPQRCTCATSVGSPESCSHEPRSWKAVEPFYPSAVVLCITCIPLTAGSLDTFPMHLHLRRSSCNQIALTHMYLCMPGPRG